MKRPTHPYPAQFKNIFDTKVVPHPWGIPIMMNWFRLVTFLVEKSPNMPMVRVSPHGVHFTNPLYIIAPPPPLPSSITLIGALYM